MEKLYLVTETYPNPGGDSNFVIPELQELKKKFEVTVICLSKRGLEAKLDSEVQYLFWNLDLTVASKLKYSCKYFATRDCWRELGQILKEGKKNIIGRLVKSFEFFSCSEEFYGFLEKNLDPYESAVFYTFWSKFYTLPLIIHKKKYSSYCLITRLHGCDLYQERYLYGRQPFKAVINNGLDRLYFLGRLSQKYYLNVYPELDKSKTIVCPLGVRKIYGKKEKETGKPFLLMSCSSVIPLKRVLWIAEALERIKEPIKWVHFGGGAELSRLRQYVLKNLANKEGVEIELKGDTSNEGVHRFYEENYVDCFITVSATEGCPVSVMEAMAAGVPVIATAVGELPLMIDENGILLGENPELEEISEAICTMMKMSEKSKRQMREKSKQIWEKYYSAVINSKKMVEDIQKLSIENRGNIKWSTGGY
ncbi:MAG: glycosyltransferase [Eisenbergiella sp.]